MPRVRTANFRGAVDTATPTLEAAQAALEETLARIDEGYETGDLDEETADALDAEALEDYQELLAANLGIDLDYDDEEYEGEYDDADYGDGTDLATFSSGTNLGAAVLELGQSEGYDVVEDLIEDLSAVTGFDPDDLADIITGAATLDDFEDPELAAHTLAQAFSVTADDDNAYDGFMTLAAQEAGYEIADGDDGEGGGDEEGDSVDYSRYRYELERDRKIETLEAQFSAAQQESAISEELMRLTREADLGYNEGWLPPAAYRSIIGEFEMDTDRFAAFSTVCESNQVDPATELYAMSKQLEAFKRCGPFVKFGLSVEEDLSPDEAHALQSASASAMAYAKKVNAQMDLYS